MIINATYPTTYSTSAPTRVAGRLQNPLRIIANHGKHLWKLLGAEHGDSRNAQMLSSFETIADRVYAE